MIKKLYFYFLCYGMLLVLSWHFLLPEILNKHKKTVLVMNQLVTLKNLTMTSTAKMEQHLELCHLNTSKLGPVTINEGHLRSLQPDKVEKANQWVLEGGHWSPINEPLNPCQPLEKLVIIFPFRNREEHLLIMLSRLHPMLRKQFLEYHIFVIEQEGTNMFNKAVLMNAGFLEAARDTQADCFIFHDVDLYPENDLNIYSCTNAPIQFSHAVSSHKYKLKYNNHYGGVIGITRSQFLKVNGYSNLYWGWGSEDDDMSKRVSSHYNIYRPNTTIGRYTMLKHKKRRTTRRDVLVELERTAVSRMKYDGLNSIKYKVVSDVKYHLYRRIKVQFDAPVTSAELVKFTKENYWKLKTVRSSRDIVIP